MDNGTVALMGVGLACVGQLILTALVVFLLSQNRQNRTMLVGLTLHIVGANRIPVLDALQKAVEEVSKEEKAK